MCYACIYQRMNKTELKNKLLETGIFIDNEWFDKYLDLVINNDNKESERFRTQRHHIIPSCYYRNNNIDIDNEDSNLVNLLLKDHLLAHCYLLLCSTDERFRTNMFYAICFISGLKIDDNIKVVDLINSDLDTYQEAYEQGRAAAYSSNPMFDNEKKARHDEIMRSDEVSNRISSTMKKKAVSGELFNDAHRKNLSKSAKLRCHAYKEDEVKRILKVEAEKYFKDGWRVPYYERDMNTVSSVDVNREYAYSYENATQHCNNSVCWIHKESTRKMIPTKQLDSFIATGWTKGSGVHQDSELRKSLFTEEVRKKLSESHKGKSPANKGVPLSEDQKKRLSDHFKNSRWMNNGVIQKQVIQGQIEEYIGKGFVFGKLKNRVKGDGDDCENSKNKT